MSYDPWMTACAVMFGCGAIGGFTNYLFVFESDLGSGLQGSPRGRLQEQTMRTRPWYSYVIGGIVAAFIVPLFLKLAQSALLSRVLASGGIEATFVFAGFCLVAAFSSKAFLDNMSRQAITIARSAYRRSQSADKIAHENLETTAELSAQLEDATSVSQSAGNDAALTPTIEPPSSAEIDALTNLERRALLTFAGRPSLRRGPVGLKDALGIERSQARDTLMSLTKKGLLDPSVSNKGMYFLYSTTPRGRAFIDALAARKRA